MERERQTERDSVIERVRERDSVREWSERKIQRERGGMDSKEKE